MLSAFVRESEKDEERFGEKSLRDWTSFRRMIEVRKEVSDLSLEMNWRSVKREKKRELGVEKSSSETLLGMKRCD